MNKHDDHCRPSGRIAALDYGSRRIGVAVTDREQRIASPLDNYQRRGEQADQAYFRQLADQQEVQLFVVGLPVHLSGEESQQSNAARHFGHWLLDVTGVPVTFFDERFTSQEADQFLAEGQLTRKQRKARRDKLAAQILLNAYLEAGPATAGSPKGLDDDPQN